jgi:branched-chain amino acid transport system permease protein
MRASLWLAGGVAVAFVAAFLVASPYIAGLLAYAAVLGIFALGLSVTLGQMGYVTFGHAAFFGLGAYSASLIAIHFGVNFWIAALASLLPGALLGVLVGFAAARLGGAYFAIATLTTGEILRLIAANWIDLTRGPMGLLMITPPLPWAATFGWNPQQSHLFILIVTVVILVIALRHLQQSSYGRAWLAVREAPDLAESLGIPTVRARVWNIAVSGGIAALAGALMVPKVFVVTPDLFGVGYSATGLLAAILGGKASVFGPLLGGFVFAVLPESLRFIDEARLAIFAIILLLVVRLLPGGILSLLPAFRRLPKPPALSQGVLPRLLREDLPAAGSEVLKVKGLNKAFAGLKATDDVSFEVRAGELVGLIGPNGAGKTTCFSQLSGFLMPDSGDVAFLGQSILGLAPHRIAALGLVRSFQQAALCQTLTVYENALIATHLAAPEPFLSALLRLPGSRRREAERQQRAEACLTAMGLLKRAGERAGDLPYGDQKLLAIGMALAARPKAVLLDEPAAGLNQVEAAKLADVLRDLRASGLTIVIVDHNLKMMMALCDRIVVLHHGAKIAEGSPAEVRRDPEVVRAYLGHTETVHDEANEAAP